MPHMAKENSPQHSRTVYNNTFLSLYLILYVFAEYTPHHYYRLDRRVIGTEIKCLENNRLPYIMAFCFQV